MRNHAAKPVILFGINFTKISKIQTNSCGKGPNQALIK